MASSQPSRTLVEAALLLVGRMHCGEPDSAQAARQALEQWRSGPPEQRAALQAAERLWHATDGRWLQAEVPAPARHDPRRARRNTLGLLGVGGLAGLLWAGGRWYGQQPVYELALQTVQGQQRDQSLPDGSEISLAAQARVRITLYRDRREVRLLQGTLRLRVAQDADRPFTVVTDWGRVRVLGTVFSVSAGQDQMRVEVAEGRVAVWPAHGDGAAAGPADEPPVTLTLGQAIEADRHGLGPLSQVPADSVGAWRKGWLVFHDLPLDRVLAQWNDYLQRPWRLGSHPRLRQLRLTGSFPLRQPQTFLAGLPDMLPVRVVRSAEGDVTVELR